MTGDMKISDVTRTPFFRDEVLRELDVLHARALVRMPFIHLMLVLGLKFVFLPFVPVRQFVGWGVLTVLMEMVRAAAGIWILRRKQDFDAQRVHRVLVVLAGLSGLIIGWSAVLFLPVLDPQRQAILLVILFAMPAAGVAVSVGARWILGTYALMILLPTVVVYLHLYPDLWVALWLTLLFFVFMVGVSSDAEKLLLRSILIRRERDGAMQALQHSHEETLQAMKRAERFAQARDRVLASASHDLRQPLHTLSLYGAVLSSNPDMATMQQLGRNIDQVVRALGHLLTGLLDLSRFSPEHYRPEQKLFDLDALVHEVCREFDPIAREKGITLIRETSPIRLMGDAFATARILRNLLDNAIKYTIRGDVRVIARCEQKQVILIVADTGIGISPKEKEHIFEEFYQIDNPTRDRNKGVGLGLAIVQRLCALIGAHIALESVLGQGAQFTVAFPVNAQEWVGRRRDEETVSTNTLSGRKIYVLDDERDILQGMQILLELWQVDVYLARTVDDMMDIFHQSGRPDVLIADLRLEGDEHGAALACRLQERYGVFPVLIMTGDISSSALQVAHEAGFVVLQKPVAADSLHAALCEMLG